MPLPEKGEQDPAMSLTYAFVGRPLYFIEKCFDCPAALNSGIFSLEEGVEMVDCAIENAAVGNNFETINEQGAEIEDRVSQVINNSGEKKCKPMQKAREASGKLTLLL